MRSKLALILNVVSVPLALAGFGLDVFLICSGRPGLTGTRCPAIGLLAWSGLCWANARSILQPDIEGSVSRRLASVATTLFVAGISVGLVQAAVYGSSLGELAVAWLIVVTGVATLLAYWRPTGWRAGSARA